MARTCTICTHAKRADIESALVNNAALRGIARDYAVSEDALARHKAAHLPPILAQAAQAAEVARADDLLGQVQALQDKTLAALGKAEAAGDLRTVLVAVREARSNVELLARLLGELRDAAPVVNVAVVTSPEWAALRTVIVRTLEPFPEARAALVEAINPMGGNGMGGTR